MPNISRRERQIRLEAQKRRRLKERREQARQAREAEEAAQRLDEHRSKKEVDDPPRAPRGLFSPRRASLTILLQFLTRLL